MEYNILKGISKVILNIRSQRKLDLLEDRDKRLNDSMEDVPIPRHPILGKSGSRQQKQANSTGDRLVVVDDVQPGLNESGTRSPKRVKRRRIYLD